MGGGGAEEGIYAAMYSKRDNAHGQQKLSVCVDVEHVVLEEAGLVACTDAA